MQICLATSKQCVHLKGPMSDFRAQLLAKQNVNCRNSVNRWPKTLLTHQVFLYRVISYHGTTVIQGPRLNLVRQCKAEVCAIETLSNRNEWAPANWQRQVHGVVAAQNAYFVFPIEFGGIC